MNAPQQPRNAHQDQHRQRTRARTLGRPLARQPSPPVSPAINVLIPRDGDYDATTTACALCATITPCLNCGKGQACQQIFRPQGDCQTCPSNVCVSDGSSSSGSSKAAAIAGPLGGVLGTISLALVLVFIWWKRRKSKYARRATARAEAKMHDAKNKGFLLRGGGSGGRTRDAAAAARGRRREGDDDDDDDDGNGGANGNRDPARGETEWTELRADGLTTFQQGSPQSGAGRLQLDMGQPLDLLGTSFDSQRRHSSAAATHLSRITEGQEDERDEDDDDHDDAGDRRPRKSQRFKDNLGVLDNIEIISSADATIRVFNGTSLRNDSRADSRTSSISSGRGGGADQHARSRSRRSLRNPFEPEDELAVEMSTITGNGDASTTSSTPVPGGRSSLGSTLSAFPMRGSGSHNDGNIPPMPTEPLPAHRPTGAPLVGLDMAKRQAGPARPIRDADLNLRLADGSEPGKIGADLKRNQTTGSAGTWRSSVPLHTYSPAAPSTAHSRQFNLLDEPLPAHPSIPSQYSEPSSAGPTPSPNAQDGSTESSAGHGEFLQVSGDWEERQRRSRKRLSARSTATTGTTATTASDYVMSSPQIVIARSANDAPRTVQVKRGAAQLVRNLSDLRRKGSLKKKEGVAGTAATGTNAHNTPVTSPQEEARDPFSDENSVAHEASAPRPAESSAGGHTDYSHDDDGNTATVSEHSLMSGEAGDAISPTASDGTFGPRTSSAAVAPSVFVSHMHGDAQSPPPFTATTVTTATVMTPGPMSASTYTQGSPTPGPNSASTFMQGSTTPAGERTDFASEVGRDAAAAAAAAGLGQQTHAHVGVVDDRSRTDSMSTYSSFGIPIMDLTDKSGSAAANATASATAGAGHPAQQQRNSSSSNTAGVEPSRQDRNSGASWTLPYLSEGGEAEAGAASHAHAHAHSAKAAPAAAALPSGASTPKPQQERSRSLEQDRLSSSSIGGLSVLDDFAWSVRTGDGDGDGDGDQTDANNDDDDDADDDDENRQFSTPSPAPSSAPSSTGESTVTARTTGTITPRRALTPMPVSLV